MCPEMFGYELNLSHFPVAVRAGGLKVAINDNIFVFFYL
jgi:hypothetical protein